MGYQRDLVASRLAPLESAGRQEGGVRGGGGHPWRPQVVSAGLRCARQGHNGFETKRMRLPPRRSRPLQQVSCTSLRRTVRPTSGRRWLAWTRAGSSGRAATHDGRL